jgi:hypothetical protein
VKTVLRTVVSLVALAVAGVPLALGSPASAAPVGASADTLAAAVAPCLTNPSARVQGKRKPPRWRQLTDTGGVTPQDLAALPLRQTRPGFVTREVTPVLPSIVTIPVYAHVIKGKRRGEHPRLRVPRVRNMINILNNGMAGKQSSASAWTRYRFSLKKVSFTRRESWFHAFFNGPRDRKMKHKLHRGNAGTLNVYFNGGGPRNNPVLGWSRFPWQYAGAPYLDGVSINIASLPGGRATGYNLGDTLIHETGHWLGLFHTFQGGCAEPGDMVSDTPAEAEPSFYCQTTRDTCTSPGLDPVHNFMDYSLDACMNMFTPGQVRRMDAAFAKWRL